VKKEATDISEIQKEDKQSLLQNDDQVIIAIGASAGGLEAIHDFFDSMPETHNLSFVVIQHLSPDYKSLLVELVSKHTEMKVYEAGNKMKVEKNCIYIIPPKMMMTISGGYLQLSEKESSNKGPNTAIDTFLFTLADDQKERAIAIILSGTGTDGTRGVEAIKQNGGLVLVQKPESSKFDGMPRSAIATGFADAVLTPEEMPKEILAYLNDDVPTTLFKNGEVDEAVLNEIFGLIYKHTGCDFHHYKLPTLLRRISRRMANKSISKIEDYLKLLRNNPSECKMLCGDFLIGVTKFFRDPAAYEVLNKAVFPGILKNKKEGETIKIWTCACSTGEEVYSIAILLDMYLKKHGKLNVVKFFATDIDGNAIDIASRGEYPKKIEKDIPEDILEKYFIKKEGKYTISQEIRKQIVFAKHDITKDPPFIKNDMISCRNMLIYMNSGLQRKIMSIFHFSLNKGGYLWLGSSETTSSMHEAMEDVDRKWKIYMKGEKSVSKLFHYDKRDEYEVYSRKETDKKYGHDKKSISKTIADEFREVLEEEVGYAALYIDLNFDIKEALGNYRKYLSLPDRILNFNLLKMVPSDLSAQLNSTIRGAWKDKVTTARDLSYREEGVIKSLKIIVKPNTNSPYTLLVLGEQQLIAEAVPVVHQDSKVEELYIADLQNELRETKNNLQAVIEELETTNEELQSSNEELLSSNEELQSSNEELQSLNEELHTLNTEHQLKINELIEVNDDLNNYFRSTDIGQVFLDKKLRIRKFNPAAVKFINLIETDIGRPFSNISSNILNHELQADIENVLKDNRLIEKEITLTSGKVSLMRIYPYVKHDKNIDGLVITFVDISGIRELHDIINGVFNASQNAIMALKTVRDNDHKIVDFKWLAANNSSEKIYNKSVEELIGASLKTICPSVDKKGLFDKYIKVVETGIPLHTEYPYSCDTSEGWWDIVAVKMMDGLAVTFTDITEKKIADEKIKSSYLELITTKEKLKRLNTELEDKINERTKELSESEERFRLVSKATNDGIWDWNLVNNSIWWSEGFYKMFGYENKDEHTTVDFWFSHMHPEDRERVKKSIYREINNNGKQWSFEYRFLRADGHYAQILDRGYILHNEHDIPYRMLGSMMDITELRRAEQSVISNIEQRKFLAESMPLIVWTANPVGNINFVNQNFTHYTGVQPDEAMGIDWKKVVATEHVEPLAKEWQKAVDNKSDFSIELKLRRHDGEYRWHLLTAKARKDEAGELTMWVGTNTDIHEQKMANEILEQRVKERTIELQKTNEALEISNHDLQQFASVASHDLKEPLRKIHLFSNILKDKYTAQLDGAATYLDRVISSSTRMTKLINDLLSFSRLSVSNLFERVDLNMILSDLLIDLELSIEEKHALIKSDKLPVIDAIPGQMHQLFQNIISNALKFTLPGKNTVIEVKCEFVAGLDFSSAAVEQGDYCRISIGDNGIGFDEQYLDKIFTIFQRLHSKQNYEGTGIGLAICKKIIDKHNGIITATSAENQGATFTFIIPVKQKELATQS
jgi:two-component system CheB/CheR fusion protein